MHEPSSKRVFAVAPMPPEKIAYALARYSRSPDSIRDSIEWVRSHDSAKFLESFYFQYGHASIADLGHLVLCFEGISELAATEIEDEQLWDGQARSSRYQDFGRSRCIVPPEFGEAEAANYQQAASELLDAYRSIHRCMTEFLAERLPKPADMTPAAYERNIAARAYDVARYCLPFGVPTGVGQVVSIRTLERQIRRLRASAYREVSVLGDEAAQSCREAPACSWGAEDTEPLAPTLARYVGADGHRGQAREDLRTWAAQNLPADSQTAAADVDLVRPGNPLAETAATLLYPVTSRSFRELYEMAEGWSRARCVEVVETALRSRSQRDELIREFRTGTYCFDFVIDIGAWRDMHRHRRCQQFRQEYTTALGYSVPPQLAAAGLAPKYTGAIESAHASAAALPAPGSHYLLPFATRSRFLFKMDFAEVEYISRLRSGVKGHISYREIAWKMKQKLEELDPELAAIIEATPPWVEDPLRR